MYEDIYKGLSEKERERMIKADIPKFEVVGHFEMTEEEKEQADKDLFRLIKEFREAAIKKHEEEQNATNQK